MKIEVSKLIQQRSEKSNLYSRLNEEQKKMFESAVEQFALQVFNGSTTRDIKYEWRGVTERSGAESLLKELKVTLEPKFGVKGGAFNSAIRNAARDVLLVLLDPKAYSTIKDLDTIRSRAKSLNFRISSGRQLSTRDTQPPSTGARTLRRKK